MTTLTPLSFSILCGVPAIMDTTTRGLEERGFHYDSTASRTVIIDAPSGFALLTLEKQTLPPQEIVVATANQCPSYWDDLWDLKPTVLLAGPHLDLAAALVRAAGGEQYRDTPPNPTPLSSLERRVLRIMAYGWDTKRIAKHLGIRPQTVMNTISHILEKLDLSNRTEAALYYWGIWQTLGQVV